MQNPNANNKPESKANIKGTQHHPSKTYKYNHRSSYKSYKYAEIGFTITKQNKKYFAICQICNRTLGNTAFARLKCHRNICKLPTSEECLDTQPLPSNNETYIPSPRIDSISQECVSQTSTDSSRLTFNLVTPKVDIEQFQVNENLLYNNYDQESQLLDEENQLKLNMIEVLLLIKYNKQLLFTNNNTKESTELWMKVLKKAQSLGLAPNDVPWTYARDSLYSGWRFHTLQKKDAIQSGEINLKLNIVDLSILQIENTPILNENAYHDVSENRPEEACTKVTENKSVSVEEKCNSKSSQTLDEMYKADLRLKMLQCESVEIENYKRSLELYELERKLKVPPSKFTFKYLSMAQFCPTQKLNGRCEEEYSDNAANINTYN